MSLKLSQRGDTLVEVLISIIVMSAVLAAGFNLANRALRANQTSSERTEVVNAMRSQLELLRSASSNKDAPAWSAIEGFAGSNNSFYLTVDGSGATVASPYSVGQDAEPSDRYEIKVERIAGSSSEGYYDFRVDAVWDGIGGIGEQNAGLTLRVI